MMKLKKMMSLIKNDKNYETDKMMIIEKHDDSGEHDETDGNCKQ